jgi:tetratricopeptide (TPR) repeat protein
MNKKIKSAVSVLLLSLILLSINSCKKFLSEKSDKRLLIPTSLTELQSLLDNYSTMNNSYCSEGEVSADNYYLTDADYDALYYEYDKRMYVWAKDHLFAPGTDGNDWNYCYKAIYTTNSVLEALLNIKRTSVNELEWDNLKGQALFFRGSRFLDAAYVWTSAYSSSASSDLGLPLRLNTNFNEPSKRSTLEQTYDQIINDIKSSIPLLPVIPLTTFRPSRPAAYGLLARTYLSMNDYEDAKLYADSCLALSDQLIDYNTLSPSADYPIPLFNSETLFYCYQSVAYPLIFSTPKIDSSLYRSYDSNDLRKVIFFVDNGDGTHSFKGNYTGDYGLSSGVTTDEIYLIRAECFARQGNTEKALEDLNSLLITRWKAGTFIPFTASDSKEALGIILNERRKELLMRGLRWMDIKRLNKEGYTISLTRIVKGATYTLPPNDLRYALPIPEDVIEESSMQQNLR